LSPIYDKNCRLVLVLFFGICFFSKTDIGYFFSLTFCPINLIQMILNICGGSLTKVIFSRKKIEVIWNFFAQLSLVQLYKSFYFNSIFIFQNRKGEMDFVGLGRVRERRLFLYVGYSFLILVFFPNFPLD
jgi:hypothetical protein